MYNEPVICIISPFCIIPASLFCRGSNFCITSSFYLFGLLSFYSFFWFFSFFSFFLPFLFFLHRTPSPPRAPRRNAVLFGIMLYYAKQPTSKRAAPAPLFSWTLYFILYLPYSNPPLPFHLSSAPIAYRFPYAMGTPHVSAHSVFLLRYPSRGHPTPFIFRSCISILTHPLSFVSFGPQKPQDAFFCAR